MLNSIPKCEKLPNWSGQKHKKLGRRIELNLTESLEIMSYAARIFFS